MSDQQQAQRIAAQLRLPTGEQGLEMAALMASSNWPMIAHCIQHLELQANQRILELGHASAAHVDFLLKQQPGLFYQGLEISPLMHSHAQALNQQAIRQHQADFQLFDGVHPKLDQPRFDRIFSVNTLYFWSEPVQLLRALYQLAKPQCIFNLCFGEKRFMQSLAFSQYNFTLYDLAELEQLIAQTDWQILQPIHAQDRVQNKLGDWVDRQFITLRLST